MSTAPTRHELLSPAGNWDCAHAAVAAGADAIYFGLGRFNARLRADNFTADDLPRLMDFLHRHGKRGIVTMNTLIFTAELDDAEQQLRMLDACGVDAIIVQDLGLARLAREIAPSLELHASTQMTITSPEGLVFVESLFPLGRAVLARELSVKELSRFRSPAINPSSPKPETSLEVFVHGALCVAYSGQCLTSESLGQRSANRGECAQACRMPYELLIDGQLRDLGEVRYLLSPQDLAAVDLLPDLVRAGVESFKIEGRLKSAEYVAAVTRIYRKALDAALQSAHERAPEPVAAASSRPADAGLLPHPAAPLSAQEPVPSPVTEHDRYALEMTFSRGLSTGWLQGSNHPYLTHGRFGKKRGPLLGSIAACGPGWVELGERTATPVAAGDGIVFDAGENRDDEQGARIWKLDGQRLLFHRNHSGLDFFRIRLGHLLWKTSDPKLDSEIRRFWQTAKLEEIQFPLHLTVTGHPGEPLAVHSRCGSLTFDVSSPSALQPAAKHPLTVEILRAQLGRLGGTRYELASLDNRLAGDCHLPLSELNQLRRDLVIALEAKQLTPTRPAVSQASLRDFLPTTSSAVPGTPQLSVLCRTLDQLAAALDCAIPVIYCDFEDPRRYQEAVSMFRSSSIHDFSAVLSDVALAKSEARRAKADPLSTIHYPLSSIHNPRSSVFLATPRILKPGETGYLKLIDHAGADGVLLRNLAALHAYRDRTDVRKVIDFSLNIANPLTARLLMETVAPDWLTVSYDLNISQALELLGNAPPEWFELTLHQHMPLFHMEHCVFCAFMSPGKDYRDCGRPCEKHVVHLRDRVGQLHRLNADVGCRNTLFHGRAQTGARFLPALLAAGLRRFRVELLAESADEAARTLRAYQKLLNGETTPADLLRQVKAFEKLGVTEGTLAAAP